MHEVLDNRLGGLSLPRKSVVRLTDRPDMTLDVYHRRKTTQLYRVDPQCVGFKTPTGWRPVVAVFYNIFVSGDRYIMLSDSIFW